MLVRAEKIETARRLKEKDDAMKKLMDEIY
jgi:hypothetical protein